LFLQEKRITLLGRTEKDINESIQILKIMVIIIFLIIDVTITPKNSMEKIKILEKTNTKE